MDINHSPTQLIRSFFRLPLVRFIVIALFVLLIVTGLWWYFFAYRPQQFIREVYPKWYTLEQAVRDARVSNYEYDPYGTVNTNFNNIKTAAEQLRQTAQEASAPNKRLADIKQDSITLASAYVDAASTFNDSFKEEADYYYNLLVDVQGVFEFNSVSLPLVGLDTANLNHQYEQTWKDFNILNENLAPLLARVQLAAVPDRLKDFHLRLASLLEESVSISRQGVEAYEDFADTMTSEKYSVMTEDMHSVLLALEDVGSQEGQGQLAGIFEESVIGSDVFDERNSVEGYLNNTLSEIAAFHANAQKTIDYIPVLDEIVQFYDRYSLYRPPVPSFVVGLQGSLVEPTETRSYAVQWRGFERMRSDMRDLLATVRNAEPPQEMENLHNQANESLDRSLASANEALSEFRSFNNEINSNKFFTLLDNLDEIRSMAESDLDFTQIWNLENVVAEQQDVSNQFEETSQGWRDAIRRYNLAVPQSAE